MPRWSDHDDGCRLRYVHGGEYRCVHRCEGSEHPLSRQNQYAHDGHARYDHANGRDCDHESIYHELAHAYAHLLNAKFSFESG